MSSTFLDGRHVGLALSGGTLKAAAHIGVIERLLELGIRPHAVAGTSAGAWIAALYAHGSSPSEMQRLVRQFSLWSLLDYGFPLISSASAVARQRLGLGAARRRTGSATGLLAGRKLESYVRRSLRKRSARLPYYLIATDLLTGLPITYSNDPDAIRQRIARAAENLPRAITASCALPGIFSPVGMDGHLLVDGAFRHYVPLQILRDVGCRRIIAVNLYSLDKDWQPVTMVHVLMRSFEILLQESIDNDVDAANVVLLEPNVGNMSWFSVREMSGCIAAGRQSVDDNWRYLQAWFGE